MALSRAEVLHIARLARIGVTDDDVTRMQQQLNVILENFEVLRQVDTEGVPPTAQANPITNVLRADEVRPSATMEDVLANAPDRDGDFFRVRAVLEF